MTRTEEEIVAKIHVMKESDFFGFITSDLVHYLSYENAKQFLKPEITEEKWTPLKRERDSITDQMYEYMEFAWDKANNCRGLSANRSINHMQAWLWMLGEDLASEEIEDYSHYGKPQLRAICEKFGWDWKKWDNGRWANNDEEEGVQPLEAAELTWTK